MPQDTSGMPQNFIAVDREQTFLMPPSLLDWVADDHLVWTILGSVEEMDLSPFVGAYRADGHGRPAYDPSMMVALLLYAYAKGNRSSRGIERECREDVAYRVICANLVPDHSTIAEFRKRHESALADLFSSVLSLCKEAGLVKVGVIAIDGTKIAANASLDTNHGYERIVREILDEAAETDRVEDELYGDARGDELPEQMRTPEGRRAALAEAKAKLNGERETSGEARGESGSEDPAVVLDLDRERISSSEQGRRGWSRDARRQLDVRPAGKGLLRADSARQRVRAPQVRGRFLQQAELLRVSSTSRTLRARASGKKRLLQKRRAGFRNAVVHHGFVGVAGNVQHPHVAGTAARSARTRSGPLISGITTSTTARSIVPLCVACRAGWPLRRAWPPAPGSRARSAHPQSACARALRLPPAGWSPLPSSAAPACAFSPAAAGAWPPPAAGRCAPWCPCPAR